MRKMLSVLAGILLTCTAQNAYAQGAGVCNRASDDIRARVNSDVQGWIDAINATDLPQHVKNAHITLFQYNQAESMKGIEAKRNECTASFKPYQQVVDAMVLIYTGGLSAILKPHMTHVDVSELLAGYPLGGPNALVPRFREQILQGDNSTVSNIIRDPWKCLTFQRKC
jgi:hypothetical protein